MVGFCAARRHRLCVRSNTSLETLRRSRSSGPAKPAGILSACIVKAVAKALSIEESPSQIAQRCERSCSAELIPGSGDGASIPFAEVNGCGSAASLPYETKGRHLVCASDSLRTREALLALSASRPFRGIVCRKSRKLLDIVEHPLFVEVRLCLAATYDCCSKDDGPCSC